MVLLTQDIISSFIGGQLEVQDLPASYYCRGTISSLSFTAADDGKRLTAGFEWLARLGADYGWDIVTPPGSYDIDLTIYSVHDAGEGHIALRTETAGQAITFYPPGGSRLDPLIVRGYRKP